MVRQRSSGPRILISTIAVLVFLAALLLPAIGAAGPAEAAIGACSSPADCLSKMTLDEKVGQMTQANKNALSSPSDITTYYLGSLLSGGGEGPNGSGGTAAQWADMYDNFQNYAVATRLGIPLIYGVDAVHGHNNVAGAVIFPHNIGLGATRNTALVEQAAAVTRDEVLGTGMNWTFAPCVTVPQNDRWGRTYEGFGEDTALVSSMGVAAVRGFQGSGLGPNTVMATAKHYVGDGGTTNGVDQGDTQVSEAVLRAIHLPPYQSAIQSNVGSIMVSYSSWNGQKMHGHQYLITTVLKGELGFDGIIVSDWAGIDQLPGDYASDVRTAINAGVDMVMVPSDYRTFISTLRAEVSAGRIPMSRIDDAVLRILEQKFALGLFSKYRTDRTYTSQVGSAAHRAVARQAVRESLVLLKNDSVLPLSKTSTYKIVVGGSHADNLGYQLGGWSITWQGGSGDITTGTTFWEAIQAAKPANVTLQNVGTNTGSSFSGDIGIAVIGETPYAEGSGDSSTLAISSANATQVSDICSKTTRCVVILMSGRPLVINNQLSQSDAFVAAWLPGTEGAGMTDVLFGDYNFKGKLPVTWPNAVSQEPINNGDGKVGLFAFGYGLSYGSVTPTTPPPTTPPPTTPPPTTPPPTTPPPTGNLALNRPATSSTNENSSLTPNLAVDGNSGTRWSSAFSDPQWIQVDLGTSYTINRVVLNWEAAYGRAYQIQVSPNASTWTTIYSTTSGDGGTDDLSVSGSGRYVRMNGTARGTAYGYSLWEFQVYGGGTPPPTTPPPTTPPPAQSPYGGTPWPIPGTIQAENYDLGGEGIAYHDTTSGNSGGAYRSDAVDIEATTDTGAGNNVGWIASGEWLEYTVNVASSGTYTIQTRVAASGSNTHSLYMAMDGTNVTGTISFTGTGAWQTWNTVSSSGISLSAGQHVLRITMSSSNFNVNWVSFTRQ